MAEPFARALGERHAVGARVASAERIVAAETAGPAGALFASFCPFAGAAVEPVAAAAVEP